MNTQKGFISLILIIIIAAAVLGTGGFFLVTQIQSNTAVNSDPNPSPDPSPIACTQEAKLCPNGSYVSRTGPNCEFAQCPGANPKPLPIPTPTPTPNPTPTPTPDPQPSENQVTLTEGQREGPLLVQKIYADHVTGINYREYPVAVTQSPVTLYIGQSVSNGCDVFLELIRIEGNTAIFIKKTDFNKPCPICLAENTLIDTPDGQIPVQNLTTGMQVWTVDKFGNRIAAIILETSKTPVPSTHQMVHVILEDGREIFASPRHPIGDGKIFNNLSVGDILDGSKIITAEKTTYDKGYTYDILPSGSTGFYFANGILIGSTLK